MDQDSIELRPTGAPALPRLRRQLSGFGVLLLALSSLSPVLSAYGIGSDVLLHAGSGAAVLFLLGIGVALVFGMVYAELGSAYPHAGGEYVGVGTILGGWAGVSSMAIWAATSGPNIAFAAKVFADYAGPLAPAVPAWVLVSGSLAAAVAVALLAVRASAWVTGLFLAVEMAAVVALIAAGLWDRAADPGAALLHPVALDAGGALAAVPFGVLALGGVSAAAAERAIAIRELLGPGALVDALAVGGGRGDVVGMEQAQVRLAAQLLDAVAEDVRERRVDADELAVRVDDAHRIDRQIEEAIAFDERDLAHLLLGLDPLAQFELGDDLAAERRERAELERRQLARDRIDDAQRADIVAIGRLDRRAGVEANRVAARHHRVVRESRVEPRVGGRP